MFEYVLDIMVHVVLKITSLLSIYLSGTQGSLVFVCICVNSCSLSMCKKVCLGWVWKLGTGGSAKYDLLNSYKVVAV